MPPKKKAAPQKRPAARKVKRKPAKTISNPVSVARKVPVTKAVRTNDVVKRREFIQLLSSGDPDASGFALAMTTNLNPANTVLFPWLSTVSAYEQYRFRSLRFLFESSTSTSERGQVVFATNVDAKDPLISTPSELLSLKGAKSARVWDSVTFTSPLNTATPKLFVRQSVSSGDDTLYDAGTFYVATLGVQPHIPIGTLWAEYEIEFYNPKKAFNRDYHLSLVGDEKSVSTGSILGDSKLLVPDGNLVWSCVPTSVPGVSEPQCQLTIAPSGTRTFLFDAFLAQAEDEDSKNYYPSLWVADNCDVKTNVTATGNCRPPNGASSLPMQYCQWTVTAIDLAKPIVLYLGYHSAVTFLNAVTPVVRFMCPPGYGQGQ